MRQINSKESSVVAIYSQHIDAERAMNLLKKNYFNINKLAIVGQGYEIEDELVGFYMTGDVIGGLSGLEAGLYSIGIPRSSVLKYQSSVKAGKFLLIAHGTTEEVAFARTVLADRSSESVDVHQARPTAAAA
jgi:hypothetical protein